MKSLTNRDDGDYNINGVVVAGDLDMAHKRAYGLISWKSRCDAGQDWRVGEERGVAHHHRRAREFGVGGRLTRCPTPIASSYQSTMKMIILISIDNSAQYYWVSAISITAL